MQRFRKPQLELVSREEYRLGRPPEAQPSSSPHESSEEEREREERERMSKRKYGLITKEDRYMYVHCM